MHEKVTAAGQAAKGPVIARPRLLERLVAARERRCVVLQAPAGSGKTSLLTAWRRELVAAGVDVAWVSLAATDDEPARFFDALLAGLAKVDPSLVQEAAMLAGRGSDDAAVEGLVIALVRAIAAHRRDLAVVFDDAHYLHDGRVVRAAQLLLDYSPANLHCALATRSALPLALGRLRAQQQLTEITLDDLRFTIEESQQLVAQLLGRADEREARALHQRTDGWAAGLKLLCLDLRRGRRGMPVRDPRTFSDYFEQEVMGQLPPESADFLLRCALPDHFDAQLCAALMGPGADVPGCERRLRLLEEQGLFLVPAGARHPDGWWRLHPLLREALATRLQALPAAEIAALHGAAWRFFEDRRMHYEAVHHALLAGATEQAAALVESCASGLFVHGELRGLVGLVRQLPEGVVQQRTGLRLWLAWAQLYEQRLQECMKSIERLQADLVDAAPGERYRLTLLRGLLAVQRDDTSGAVKLLPDLLSPPPDADGIALTGRRSLLTWIHLYRGEYEQARHVQLEQTAPLVDGQPLYGTAFGVLAGRCLVGLSHAVEGQVIQAERIYRDVLYEADRRGASCADAGTLAAALLGEILYELNDPASALGLLEPRLDVMERVSIPDTRVRMMLVMGRARWLLGRPLDAFDYLEQSQDHSERTGLDRMLAYTLLEELQFRLRQGETSKAQGLLASLETLDARHTEAATGALSEIRVVAERARIRLWLAGGDLDRALGRIDALIALCRQRGRIRRIPYLQLQAAGALRELGQHDAAHAQVREALRHGHRLGLVRTLLDAHAQVPALVREAIADPALDPVLLFYAERLDAAAREPAGLGVPLAVPARPGVEVLSPREAEIVQLLLQNLPNKKIARALDLSLDTVKWHLKNVYGKLGASGRDEVVERLRG